MGFGAQGDTDDAELGESLSHLRPGPVTWLSYGSANPGFAVLSVLAMGARPDAPHQIGSLCWLVWKHSQHLLLSPIPPDFIQVLYQILTSQMGVALEHLH